MHTSFARMHPDVDGELEVSSRALKRAPLEEFEEKMLACSELKDMDQGTLIQRLRRKTTSLEREIRALIEQEIERSFDLKKKIKRIDATLNDITTEATKYLPFHHKAITSSSSDRGPGTPTVQTPSVHTPIIHTPSIHAPSIHTPSIHTPSMPTPHIHTPGTHNRDDPLGTESLHNGSLHNERVRGAGTGSAHTSSIHTPTFTVKPWHRQRPSADSDEGIQAATSKRQIFGLRHSPSIGGESKQTDVLEETPSRTEETPRRSEESPRREEETAGPKEETPAGKGETPSRKHKRDQEIEPPGRGDTGRGDTETETETYKETEARPRRGKSTRRLFAKKETEAAEVVKENDDRPVSPKTFSPVESETRHRSRGLLAEKPADKSRLRSLSPFALINQSSEWLRNTLAVGEEDLRKKLLAQQQRLLAHQKMLSEWYLHLRREQHNGPQFSSSE